MRLVTFFFFILEPQLGQYRYVVHSCEIHPAYKFSLKGTDQSGGHGDGHGPHG